MNRVLCLLVGVAFGLPPSVLADGKADAVVGMWWTDGKQSKIEIYKKGEKYHGKIAWIEEPEYGEGDPEAGQPKHDRNNPDAARRQDPLVGLNLIKDFVFDDSGKWSGGTIYDPESGKTYKCTMRLRDEKTLYVRGYIGIPAFGRSTTWTRVEKPEEEAEIKSVNTSRAGGPRKPPEASRSDGKQLSLRLESAPLLRPSPSTPFKGGIMHNYVYQYMRDEMGRTQEVGFLNRNTRCCEQFPL